MKKTSITQMILLTLSIIIIIPLLSTSVYLLLGLDANTDPNFYNSISLINGLLFDLALCLTLSVISVGITNMFKKYRVFNYIPVIIGLFFLVTNIYILQIFWWGQGTQLYVQLLSANKFLEKVVACLILISALIANKNTKTK